MIRNLKTNLLGYPAIVALDILKQSDAIKTKEVNLREQFPNFFKGLRDQGDEYHIQLKEGAVPHCLYTPRSVPMPKVQNELNHTEAMGVISKVSEPTEWCAGMVVPKKSGEVRICIDLKALNDNVLREVHPIPKVEETLAQLAGAAVY